MTPELTVKDPRTHLLIGAAMDVHNVLGSGFGEAACRAGFAIELQLRGVSFMTEVPFPIFYKEHKLPVFYRADFVCYGSIIVEVKSMAVRTGLLEQAQMLKYLRTSAMAHGLLFNFGLSRLEYRRFILSDHSRPQHGLTEVSEGEA